jgi:hypothetical protein
MAFPEAGVINEVRFAVPCPLRPGAPPPQKDLTARLVCSWKSRQDGVLS